MPDYSNEIIRQTLAATTEAILEVIAKEGLVALKRVLDESGFAESENLKDYEIFAKLLADSVEFEIVVDVKGIDEQTKRKMRKENEDIYRKQSSLTRSKTEAREFLKIYTMHPKTKKPERIVGLRDARRPPREARRFQRDARKIAYDRARADVQKGSGERYVEHEFAATNPRGMEVDELGKLRITMQREIRNTKKGVIFPKDNYQGIIKRFVEQINEIIESKFSPALESILRSHLK